ncbi:unnamed protein product [Symbiodinium natans]|uniref:Uncharacterized protein n=1 Tax=Symbiodinium natans TaxID=878477 RepID=A0A812HGM0_9DINO|nr:unnamed protein product [Symbiodinium natans]
MFRRHVQLFWRYSNTTKCALRRLRRDISSPLRKVSQVPQIQVNSGSQRRLVPLRKVSHIQAQVTSRSLRRLVPLRRLRSLPGRSAGAVVQGVPGSAGSGHSPVEVQAGAVAQGVPGSAGSGHFPFPAQVGAVVQGAQVPQAQVTSPTLCRLVPLRKVSQVAQALVAA